MTTGKNKLPGQGRLFSWPRLDDEVRYGISDPKGRAPEQASQGDASLGVGRVVIDDEIQRGQIENEPEPRLFDPDTPEANRTGMNNGES